MPPDILNNSRGKIIQVHRNPADIAVSFYHHNKLDVNGTALAYDWDDYISKLFWDEERMISSTWSVYTCDWWTRCHGNSNYMPVFYEELKEDPVKVIREIAKFLEVEAEQELLEQIAAETSIEKMKVSKREREVEELGDSFVEGYSMYRKGVVGDWRNHFTEEQHEQFIEHYNQELRNHPELHQRFIKYLQF
ncbi:sulfotransferase 1B1-like [Watersipora subatra]|uniref:sulfotransferase 1B1-like n=1 Tax=Watersipora subatra TaxID=2589382 RepID=UPI00355C1BBA